MICYVFDANTLEKQKREHSWQASGLQQEHALGGTACTRVLSARLLGSAARMLYIKPPIHTHFPLCIKAAVINPLKSE
jgi:hypothetical protein